MDLRQNLSEYLTGNFGIDSCHIDEMWSLIDDINDSKYFITPTGVPGFYNLGEKGNKFLWVSGGTPYEILKFVKEQCRQTVKISSDIKSQETPSL